MSEVLGIFGRRGTGKSCLARWWAKRHVSLIVFDPLHEHQGLGRVCRGRASFLDSLSRSGDRSRIVFQPEVRSDESAILEVMPHVSSTCFLLDEVDRLCSPTTLPETLHNLVHYGRHKGLSLIYCSRRPADVSRALTSQSDHVATFLTVEPRDLDYFRQSGFDRDLVLKLRGHDFYMWPEGKRCILRGNRLTFYSEQHIVQSTGGEEKAPDLVSNLDGGEADGQAESE